MMMSQSGGEGWREMGTSGCPARTIREQVANVKGVIWHSVIGREH